MVAAELGLVDYFKLAFRLFGFRVESAFYLYFLILGVSLVAFILGHWRSPITLTIPILFLAAGNIVLGSNFFDSINSQNVTNPRFLSTLGILPGIHILMLMLDRHRASLPQVLLACVQALIFEFALSIRASLAWLMLFVATIAVIQIAVAFARLTTNGSSVRRSIAGVRDELAATRLWPALVLLIGVWSYQTAITASMHPSYELDDFLPSHLRYHNAFIGLSYNPRWAENFQQDYYRANSDQLGFLAGAMYLMDNYDVPESYYQSPLYGGPKMQLDDRVVRKAYLQFIRRNPWFVIQAHYWKLRVVLRLVTGHLWTALSNSTIALLSAGAVVIALLLSAGWRRHDSIGDASARGARHLLVISAGIAMFSWIPFVYAQPSEVTVGDAIWATGFTLLVACFAAVATLWSAAVTRARALKWIR
jgi:hypothetical protein